MGLLAKTAQDLVLAYVMGTGGEVDVFGIVIAIMSPAVTIVIGPVVISFLPGYITALERGGRDAANRVLETVFPVTVLAAIGLTAVLEIAAPFLLRLVMRANFSEAAFDLGVDLLRLCFLLVPLRVGTRLTGAVLNADHTFAIPTATGAIPPLIATASLAGLGHTLGVYAVVVGLIVGEVAQLILLTCLMLRRTGCVRFFQLRYSNEIREMAGQYFPILIGSSIAVVNPVIDRAIAGGLGEGSISHLFYGQKLVGAGLEVATFAISTVLLPLFSRLVAAENWGGLRRVMTLYSALIFAASLPVILGFQLFSQDLVRLTLQHGSFEASDSVVVAAVMRCLAVQIPFYVAGILAARVVAALRLTYLLTIGAVGNVIVNIAFDLWFVKLWGLPGIALATGVVYAWSFLYLAACSLFVIRRRLARDRDQQPSAAVQSELPIP